MLSLLVACVAAEALVWSPSQHNGSGICHCHTCSVVGVAAQIQSLAHELPYSTGTAKKERKKKKECRFFLNAN